MQQELVTHAAMAATVTTHAAVIAITHARTTANMRAAIAAVMHTTMEQLCMQQPSNHHDSFVYTLDKPLLLCKWHLRHQIFCPKSPQSPLFM